MIIENPPEWEHAVPAIDLDLASQDGLPADDAPPRPRSAWRLLTTPRLALLPTLALLLATGAAAGVGTHQWDVRQQRRAQESILSVTIIPPEGASFEYRSGGSDDRLAATSETTVNVTLVNSGPLPVEVSDIQANESGLTLASDETTLVRPGVRRTEVTVRVDCSTPRPPDLFQITMSVRTADGQSHRLSRLTFGRTWFDMVNSFCHLGPPR